jgi:hypothetical protein
LIGLAADDFGFILTASRQSEQSGGDGEKITCHRALSMCSAALTVNGNFYVVRRNFEKITRVLLISNG